MATGDEATFFEALTAAAFLVFAEKRHRWTILECGLGGRLDATNVCEPELCVITRIGLDHCQWLGDTLEKISTEKAGIIKPGAPVVLGKNCESVRAVVSARAKELGAPFIYAPDIADESEIPADYPLAGSFNQENAVTAIAALKTLHVSFSSFSSVVWSGRFQRVGNFIIDGAHNPPAAAALSESLRGELPQGEKIDLIAGFCGDKDAASVLRTLSTHVRRGFAVRIDNPRSMSAEATADEMRRMGIDATPCASLKEALAAVESNPALICGSLFLAGEALVSLGAYPWTVRRRDPSETLLRQDCRTMAREACRCGM
jgi:dihydrofolate synthase/folylpolyglutamate synthase